MSLRHHIPLALSSLMLLGAPAVTQAAVYRDIEYRVEVDATLQASHARAELAEKFSLTQSASTTSKIHAVIPSMLFRNNEPYLAAGRATGRTTGSAQGSFRAPDASRDQACTPKNQAADWGFSAIGPDEIPPLTPNHRLHVRVADAPGIDWGCSGSPGTLGIPGYILTDGKNTLGTAALDASFDLPFEAVGYGKIIQRIQGPPSNFCAGQNDPHTTSCSYSWSGTVTFVKTGDSTFDDDPQPPGGGGSGSGTPAPVQGSKIDMRDLIAPLVINDADLVAPLVLSPAAQAAATGKSVSFQATCPAGCSGSAALTVSAAAGKASAARAAKPLATIPFTVKAGKAARTVKLRLPGKAARALRRAARGRLAVTLKPKGSKKAVRRTLTVKVAKKR